MCNGANTTDDDEHDEILSHGHHLQREVWHLPNRLRARAIRCKAKLKKKVNAIVEKSRPPTALSINEPAMQSPRFN